VATALDGRGDGAALRRWHGRIDSAGYHDDRRGHRRDGLSDREAVLQQRSDRQERAVDGSEVGGAACVVLTSPQLRRAPTSLPVIGGREVSAALVIPLCAASALLGGLYAIIHGIGGMVTKLLGLLGIVDIPFPAEAWVTVDMVALSLWDLLLYEPWFLAMGLCLLLSLRSYALDKGVRPGAVRAAGRACAALVAVGSAGFMWMIVTDNVVVI